MNNLIQKILKESKTFSYDSSPIHKKLKQELENLTLKYYYKGCIIDSYAYSFSADYNNITLERILINKKDRNQGLGTKALTELCLIADKYDYSITLNPTNQFGSGIRRLIKFYNRFGFIKNNDYRFREKMIRYPS